LGEFTSGQLVSNMGNVFSFKPAVLSGYDWHKLFAEKKRRFDVSMRFPLQNIDELDVDYPKQWTCISSVQSDSLVSNFGKFCWSMDTNVSGRLLYHRCFQLDSTYVSKKQYGDLQRFLNGVAISDQKFILFYKLENKINNIF
jgi:hypothetical protein